jgi:probable HAF family extracellular repeat protein
VPSNQSGTTFVFAGGNGSSSPLGFTDLFTFSSAIPLRFALPDSTTKQKEKLMKPRKWTIALSLSAVLAMPIGIAAQDNEAEHHKPRHHTYKVIDLGTLGGPNSFYFSQPVVESVNNRGTVVGAADTSLPDPYAPNCDTPDCLILHAFEWRNGSLTDLGTLPYGHSSTAFWVSDTRLIMGGSENGEMDPITGIPENIAVVWNRGEITSLGTLGGSFSFGNAMNNRGQVVGIALNAIPDPLSFVGLGTQTRAFLWQDGQMQDLGTLGGPDSWGAFVNERGQVVGWSYTDSMPNPTTGIPTQHPFLWENGEMHDLKTLGGTLAVAGAFAGSGGGAINNRGQIIGTSNLAGDLTHHPFLWERGMLKDLGTLGGNNGEAYWINDSGDVVGTADLSGSRSHHAFLWKNEKMKDLGAAVGWPCSTARSINSAGEIIVDTGICGVGGGPGSISENGEPIVDLNTLVLPGSELTVGDVNYINDRGEIAATGLLTNGDQHAILLVPSGDCDDECEARITASQNHTALAAQPNLITRATIRNSETEGASINSLRDRFRRRHHLPGSPAMPLN